MKFRKISIEAVGFLDIPQKGIAVDGIYRGSREVNGTDGPYTAYLLELSDDGSVLKGGKRAEAGDVVLVSGKALEALEQLNDGAVVRLSFGELSGKGSRKYRPCEVWEGVSDDSDEDVPF